MAKKIIAFVLLVGIVLATGCGIDINNKIEYPPWLIDDDAEEEAKPPEAPQ